MGQVIRTTLPIVDAVAARIEELGISNRRAAEELGVSHQTVPNWLRGSSSPPLDAKHQAAFARFLEISPREVIELYGLDLSSERAMRPYLAQPVDARPLGLSVAS